MEVLFSPRSLEDLQRVADFLEKKWSKKTADRLIDAAFAKAQGLKKFPFAYPLLKDGDGLTRKCLILGKTIMTYKVVGEEIRVTAFYDGREDYERD